MTTKTKTISQIGKTKFDLVKDSEHDAFIFKVDDRTAEPSPKTVMYISSNKEGAAEEIDNESGLVIMSNVNVAGKISAGNIEMTDTASNITVAGQIFLKADNNIRASIYAVSDPSAPSAENSTGNHRLIIDPYQIDDQTSSSASTNNGTVYIRGNLIVEGNKTILDTAEHVTSDNFIGINATRTNDEDDLVGGAANTAGITVYYQANTESDLMSESLSYDFISKNWSTQDGNLVTKNITAVDITASGTTSITGNLTINTDKFTVDSTNGNTSVSGTLVAAGATTLSSDVGVIGQLEVDGNLIGNKGVNAITIGNIVPVELTSGSGREDVQSLSSSAISVPLHTDILDYFAGKTFAAGKCVVALANETEASVAMFSFSKCGSVLTLVLDQEVHSNNAALSLDYDSTTETIDLIMGTAADAKYCVKVLPIMTSESINGMY